ncbi:MAG: DUF4982 domain-containing protein, partial [Bacteroidales bacterium]|nr:DUF4982 domain-containing protein [Bacteroidales bacterium]
MKPSRILFSIITISCLYSVGCSDISKSGGRVTENFNFDWRFIKEDVSGAETPQFDDSGWRQLDLPHDWTVEGPFSEENSSCTGYLPGGTGWYRKSFRAPELSDGKRLFISFGGIYNNSTVWVNGNMAGYRPNGYISFQYDITDYLKPGKENVIAVRVNHTQDADSRWYTGSGIYRDVRLVTVAPVHIKQWGVWCTTPLVTKETAQLTAEVSLVNSLQGEDGEDAGEGIEATVNGYLLFGSDTVATRVTTTTVPAGGETTVTLTMEVDNPKLWSTDEPNLYRLVTVVESEAGIDNTVTPVGFRTIKFDPVTGFWLNDVNMKLKGICMHHDAGTLGAAVPREELARRLDILKELGCNAIRTSHNPFSTDFNELCDEKGFLVIAEMFDEWELPKKKWLAGWNVGTPGKEGYAEYFGAWGVTDLHDFIMRDRNHPSIIMWSIGNEVDYPNDPYTHPILNTEANPQTWAKFSEALPHADRLGEVARELANVIKELDVSRPVTAGLASALMSNETGYAAALDVAGYNYQEFRYEPDHKRFPDRPLYGSENGMALDMWEAVEKNDYVMGQFLWTGFEYLGEAGRFPSRSNTAGIIDLAGNSKPEFYFRQSLWSDKPMVFIGTTSQLSERGPVSLWAHKRVNPVWNYEDGRTISVSAFSNCEEVELFLNDISLGARERADFTNRTITWEVPYAAGRLRAVARNNGQEVASHELVTAGGPAALKAECTKSSIKADRTELVHIFVTVVDSSGNLVYGATNDITCEVEGPLRLIGMEDANPANI